MNSEKDISKNECLRPYEFCSVAEWNHS